MIIMTLVMFAFLCIIMVVPIMISARIFNAENTSFFFCLIAAIGSIFAGHFSEILVSNTVLSGVLAVAISGVFFSLALRVNYVPAIMIALLAYGILMVVGLALPDYGVPDS